MNSYDGYWAWEEVVTARDQNVHAVARKSMERVECGNPTQNAGALECHQPAHAYGNYPVCSY